MRVAVISLMIWLSACAASADVVGFRLRVHGDWGREFGVRGGVPVERVGGRWVVAGSDVEEALGGWVACGGRVPVIVRVYRVPRVVEPELVRWPGGGLSRSRMWLWFGGGRGVRYYEHRLDLRGLTGGELRLVARVLRLEAE